jgi:hypothetical protein
VNDRADLLARTAGVTFAVFAVSGVLNTTDLAPHPGWIPPTIVLAVFAAAAMARSLRLLVRSPQPAADPEPSTPTDL